MGKHKKKSLAKHLRKKKKGKANDISRISENKRTSND